jgi:tRNA A-37 threonylcarbamoyl transferase component Bud32
MRQALASRTIDDGDHPAPASPPLTPEELGEKFPGYEILQCLGRGGMGVVYKARQKSLNRIVAIKILAPERGGETRFAERFASEAELLARLNHPHIVTIHDFGEIGGLYYLVMEFVDGVNLRDLLRDGKLEPKQALAIVPPICDALQYAHDKGIVHRDIKPENLLLDRDGRVKIADFGIASLVGANGEIAGTPPYMAPEQSAARNGIDHRADIYALGVVLYEMLTGERPDREVVAPSSRVRIDVRLDEIVLRALEKNPELRYQTAGEFRTVVETMAGTASPAPDASGREDAHAEKTAGQIGMFEQRRRALLWYGFIASLLGLPVGLALDVPIVWGLSIAGILIGGHKLRVLGKLHARHNTAGEFRTVVDTMGAPPVTHGSPAALLKSAESLYATPEFLSTVWGAMKIHQGMGVLLLYSDRLELQAGLLRIAIPLCSVRRLDLISYPFFQSPAGLRSIEVEFEEAGTPRRLVLTPSRGTFSFVGTTNNWVSEWFGAIREAIRNATGSPPAGSPSPIPYQGFSSDGKLVGAFVMLASFAALFGILAALVLTGTWRNVLPAAVPFLFGISFVLALAWRQRRQWQREHPLPVVNGSRQISSCPTPPALSGIRQRGIFRNWWRVIALGTIILAAIAWFLSGPGKHYPASSMSAAYTAPVIGRIEFKCAHAEGGAGAGTRISFDVKAWGDTQWKPSSGHSISLEGERTILFKTRVDACRFTPPMAMVTASLNGKDWETRRTQLRAESCVQTMDFTNGLQVTIRWWPVVVPDLNRKSPDPIQQSVMRRGAESADQQHPPTDIRGPQAFGHVTERVVHEMESGLGNEALRLESGELFSLPKSMTDKWLAESSADLLVGRTGADFQLILHKGILRDMSNADWDHATPETFRRAMEKGPGKMKHGKSENRWGAYDWTGGQVPATFGFHLASRAEGMLQVLGDTPDGTGLRIRYKLLPGPNRETILPPDFELVRDRATEIARRYYPDFKGASDGDRFIMQRNLHEFDVHNGSKTGDVSAETRKETGPAADGFRLVLEPLVEAQVSQAFQAYGPQILDRPYWKSFVDHRFDPEKRTGVAMYFDFGPAVKADFKDEMLRLLEEKAQEDKIAVEDLALHMIVAIRGKDDAKLKSLASDRIKGWPDALPVFAIELREHMRQFTGDEKFELQAGESLVDGDLAAVRCTGPAALQGKCLVMFFGRSDGAWKNLSLRNATQEMPLAKLLGDFRKQLEKTAESEKQSDPQPIR